MPAIVSTVMENYTFYQFASVVSVNYKILQQCFHNFLINCPNQDFGTQIWEVKAFSSYLQQTTTTYLHTRVQLPSHKALNALKLGVCEPNWALKRKNIQVHLQNLSSHLLEVSVFQITSLCCDSFCMTFIYVFQNY